MNKKIIYGAALALSLLLVPEVDASNVQSTTSISTVAFSGQATTQQQFKEELVKLLQTYSTKGDIAYTGPAISEATFNQIVQEIYLQHPYIEGTVGSISYQGSSLGSTTTYSFNVDLLTTAQQEKYVDEQIPKIVAEIIKPGMTDVQKVKAVNDYIVLKTTYSLNSKASPHVPYTILTEGKGVCQAYALLAQRLFEEIGIESRYVTGYVGAEKHAWNMVKLDGQWFHLDTTWNDPEIDNSVGVYKRHISYDYFLISDAQILNDHAIDNRGYPKATTKKYDSLSDLNTYLYTTTVTMNRTPYFVNDKIYGFKKNSDTVDFSIYEANINDNPIKFTKIPKIEALTFAASEEAIYYVNRSQQLIKYIVKTKNETVINTKNKKVTDLYVENNVLTAKNGNETVYSERLRETSSALIQQLEEVVKKLAVIDADFETNYAALKELEAQIDKNNISIATQREISQIGVKYNQLMAVSNLPKWKQSKTTTNATKSWTVRFNDDVKNSDSNLAKIKVVDLTKKQLDVSIKISGSTIIVTPTNNYNANIPYFLLIDAGLESVNGEVTKKGIQMRFTFTQ